MSLSVVCLALLLVSLPFPSLLSSFGLFSALTSSPCLLPFSSFFVCSPFALPLSCLLYSYSLLPPVLSLCVPCVLTCSLCLRLCLSCLVVCRVVCCITCLLLCVSCNDKKSGMLGHSSSHRKSVNFVKTTTTPPLSPLQNRCNT